MKIACIGWGSLIWRPENLQIQNKWYEDGPILPIEFTRQSDNDRITLIIDKSAKPIRTFWALMTVDDLPSAIESLKQREGCKTEGIRFVKSTDKNNEDVKSTIIKWLKTNQIDAAIWTGLSYSKKTDNNRPSIEYVVKHLKGLDYNTRKIAEEYIRKAPKQIDTEYRRIIEFELGWTHVE
jgi:hypothetical protein